MAKQLRLIKPDCHRPVNFVQKAVLKAMATYGYLIAQYKEDGIRLHAFIDDSGTVRVTTREGIEIRSLAVQKEKLRALLQELPKGFCVDGEAVVPGVVFEVGSGMLRSYDLLPVDAEFYVWDAFPLEALLGAEYGVPYVTRYLRLGMAYEEVPRLDLDQVRIIYCQTVRTQADIDRVFEQARAAGKEGLVIKAPGLGVIHGKKTGQWKVKPSDTADGRVTGLLWGTPGLGNAGKIIGFTVELESGVLCDVTGITQAQMEEFTANERGTVVHTSTDIPTRSYVGRYIEVEYMEMTAAGSLRHPSFKCFRDLDYSPGWKS